MTKSRILVVEDEALIADDIQRTLLRLGYDVPAPVATGASAVAAASELRPALALMDIKLRGPMDGIEAAAIIRREHDVPIVFLTSHSDDATLARAMETGPSGYLLKPFSDRELRTAIEVALNKHMLEVRLAERERWFSTTLQSIGDAVIATDRSESITFMNSVAETLTGWRASDAIGRSLREVFRLVDGQGEPLERHLKLGSSKSFAVELPADADLLVRGGGQHAIDDSAAAIVDDRGNVLGGVLVFRDVTERRKIQERLHHAERLASVGALAAGMGHEINNPLTSVVSNVAYAREVIGGLRSMLQSGAAAEALAGLVEVEEALLDASDGADRVRRIVADLRRFATGKAAPPTLLELSEVLDAAATMTAHAVRHHAKLTKAYGTTPYLEADEGQLVQVFTNLIVNAVQAMPDGRAEQQEIVLATYTDVAGRAVAEVRDNGPGIPPERLSRIFEPFFSTKSGSFGMGLGLAISHNIVISCGGEIEVESTMGRGTVFRIAFLPVRSLGAAAPAVDGPIASTSGARRGRILIVDDEVALGRALERILQGGHDVTLVSSGAEALARIAGGAPYDIVFCDLMMPVMSGVDVYETLVAANPEQARRMVFMTGGAFSLQAERFVASTLSTVVEKPFVPTTVRAIAADFVR